MVGEWSVCTLDQIPAMESAQALLAAELRREAERVAEATGGYETGRRQ